MAQDDGSARDAAGDALSRALSWSRARAYSHRDFGEERLRREKRATVSVCVPAREEAATIAPIVELLVGLRERGVIDEVVVLDSDSHDGTGAIAARAGAVVHRPAALMPHLGAVLGKGDAMWRALSVLTGEVVCYLDADSEDFGVHFARGLIGPLVSEPGVQFVKASYRRPFKAGEVSLAHGGGRVNDLTARPLLARFYPELSALRQPLAGEFAARRDLLVRMPFATGYGVEIGLLIDAYLAHGLDGLAQVDLGVRQNRHQSLSELGPMAYAVLGAVTRRLGEEGRLHDAASGAFLTSELEVREVEALERPPFASVSAASATSRLTPGADPRPDGAPRAPAATR